jgi:hypothetical protein
MMKNRYLIFACLIYAAIGRAQGREDSLPKVPLPTSPQPVQCMSTYAAQVYQNKTFASIATGQSKTSDLANYAALDPTKGVFSLNGFVSFKPIPKPKSVDDSSRSFLSFSLTGALLNNDATVLFKNQKLNTSLTLDIKYHFHLKGMHTHIICDENSVLTRPVARLQLEQAQATGDALDKFDPVKNNGALLLLRARSSMIPGAKLEKQQTLNHVLIQIDSTDRAKPNRKTWDAHDYQLYTQSTEKAGSLNRQLDSLNKASNRDQLDDDSLVALIQHAADSLRKVPKLIDDQYKQKILQVELSTKIYQFSQNWFTVLGSLSNRSYYTYFDSLAFDKQISQHKLLAYSVGLQYNMYWQNLSITKNKRVDYLNFGLLRLKTDNTGDLSTTTIDQTQTTVSGNTTREISSSYCSYTSRVQTFQEWNVYSNFYHLFGPKTFSGFHIYPDLEIRDNQKTLLNAGAGYIVSLPAQKSGNPLVNLEVYVRFTDLTNALKATNAAYQRYTIGLTAGLPFNFLTN